MESNDKLKKYNIKYYMCYYFNIINYDISILIIF